VAEEVLVVIAREAGIGKFGEFEIEHGGSASRLVENAGRGAMRPAKKKRCSGRLDIILRGWFPGYKD
jgi:hypothetical protein